MKNLKLVLVWIGLFGGGALAAQDPEYPVYRTEWDAAPLLAMDAAPWTGAHRIAWGPPSYLTEFRALWNEAGLYIRFDVSDDSPWHTMKKRDDHLWEEEVVEIFLDLDRSGRHYAELEINPVNVICDLHMLTPWPEKASDIRWDFKQLQSRTFPTLDAGGKILGWTALAVLPWQDFSSLPSAQRVNLPPREGDRWRFNVFRIERPAGKEEPAKDAVFAAWSPPSQPSFHSPAAFRDFVFR